MAVNTVIPSMSFTVPNGAQYRFALYTTSTNYYSGTGVGTASPNSFTNSGVTLRTGDYQISGMYVGYGATNNPRFFTGSVTFSPAGPPCTAPTVASITKSSTGATGTWSAVPGSIGYEYIFSTSATPPATGYLTTTATSASATGLTPSTGYYLHVRNKCAATNFSTWTPTQFNTNPPCKERLIKIKNITNDSAGVNWDTAMHASGYEYVISETRLLASGTVVTTSSNSFTAKSLKEGTKYYVWVRMKCQGNEFSGWVLDSFITRTICRPPVLNVTAVNQERAVIYWDHMPTAISYEYEVSQSPTPMGKGTTVKANTFQAYPMKDNQVYYFHVKSKCNDQGFISESDWTTTSYKTWATSVSNIAGNTASVSVYPNPVNDVLNISISGKANPEAQLTMMDVNGRIVYQSGVDSSKGQINMSKLPAGLYLLKYADATHSEVIKVTRN
ncbi:MAG: T9SS type A sorting domain-containing protein [Sphingobacteriales bacterium]|nr:MAG: T9SS type A sorting domain-containing protein [Sphingobacteriales bacterium]